MEIPPDAVPMTMAEAVATIAAGLSDEDKTVLRRPDTTAEMFHFGVGRFVRNAWSMWEDTPLRRDCIVKWGIAHGDDLSGLLLAWVIATVREDPFDPEQHCQRYHERWKRHGTTSLAAAGITNPS